MTQAEIADLLSKAEQGDLYSRMSLAISYARGDGVAKNETEAVIWYRKAAELGDPFTQYVVGSTFKRGDGVPQDSSEALKWFRKAADQGNPEAQLALGHLFANGQGIKKDESAAIKWYRKAAEQGYAPAQASLGNRYRQGNGVKRDPIEAVKWYRKAAEKGIPSAQYNLGVMYSKGEGVARNKSECYKWWLIAASQGHGFAKRYISELEQFLTGEQRIEGQRLARNFKLHAPRVDHPIAPIVDGEDSEPRISGTGFFISSDGYVITNRHVADEGASVRIITASGVVVATVLKVDKANDFALLKAVGEFKSLPVASSKGVRLGATVATVGFPNIGLQGFSPKLSKGEIASLAGAQDDARHFQISAPIQPGNSGGPLVDGFGNVIGVVVAKLSQRAAIASTGTLAENVNYAVKSSYLVGFLQSVPEVFSKLKEPITEPSSFEDVVSMVRQAAVLVLVY